MGYSNAVGAAWHRGMDLSMPRPARPRLHAVVPTETEVRESGADRRPPAVDESERLAPLLALIKARDEAALGTFYDATVSKVFGLALRIVGTAALAEEVVVDTYHQVWREATRFDSARGVPMAWLMMMCRSRALDALRSRDPAISHEDPSTLADEADDALGADPLDLVAAVESRSALHGALMRLAPAQRQLLALAFFRGMTHEEIAEQAALPLGTVKSQIRRALASLRRTLEPAGGAP